MSDQRYCKCGNEMDTDCMGRERCDVCDGPCPHCFDGGGPGYDDDDEEDCDEEDCDEE